MEFSETDKHGRLRPEGSPRPPVIALTASTRPAEDYAASIRAAGGQPEIVDASTGDVAALLARVDGVLLSGGEDVNPDLYGEARHPSSYDAAPGRDEFELELARQAVRGDVPVLAICRGLQVLNVALGGTLVQDIPTQLTTSLSHDVQEPRDAEAHTVEISPDSKLFRILENRLLDNHLFVNSRHHQAVGKVGQGLQIAATAPDGVIEAAECPGATFCVGVQWHPENFVGSGHFHSLFKAFIQACRDRKDPEGSVSS